MKLIVKRISGPDCSVEVGGAEGVPSLKKLVENELSAPAHAIRLVFKGRTLTDDKTVQECGLKEGDKIYAVIKKDQLTTPPPEASPASTSNGVLWTQLLVFLRKYFREQDAQKVLVEFKKDFELTVASLSLDDIERLAIANLESQRR